MPVDDSPQTPPEVVQARVPLHRLQFGTDPQQRMVQATRIVVQGLERPALGARVATGRWMGRVAADKGDLAALRTDEQATQCRADTAVRTGYLGHGHVRCHAL